MKNRFSMIRSWNNAGILSRFWAFLLRNSLRTVLLSIVLFVIASPLILNKIHTEKINRAIRETVTSYAKDHYGWDETFISISPSESRAFVMKAYGNYVTVDGMSLDIQLSPDGRQIVSVEEQMNP